MSDLYDIVREGDILFTAIPNALYRRVARATRSWVSHVGWVHTKSAGQCLVAESRVPLSCLTELDRFVARTEEHKLAVLRLRQTLSDHELQALRRASDRRMGKLYHPWFNYDSALQYCSKLVYDVYREALGIELGTVTTLTDLLQENPAEPLLFWRLWHLGHIPWQQRAISPASQYRCALLETIFDNSQEPAHVRNTEARRQPHATHLR